MENEIASVYKVEYSPARVGGGETKMREFGDGEENQRVEKKKKSVLSRRSYTFSSSKSYYLITNSLLYTIDSDHVCTNLYCMG